jgi:hypothetical protein
LTLAAVACVVPALAFAAADPKPNSHFIYCKKQNNCPMDFNTNKAGTKIVHLSLYPKCSPIPVGKKGFFPDMKVENGKFSGKGKIDNVLGDPITYDISGKFKKPKKAVGTYDVDAKDCSDGAHKFVAKRDGKAETGF